MSLCETSVYVTLMAEAKVNMAGVGQPAYTALCLHTNTTLQEAPPFGPLCWTGSQEGGYIHLLYTGCSQEMWKHGHGLDLDCYLCTANVYIPLWHCTSSTSADLYYGQSPAVKSIALKTLPSPNTQWHPYREHSVSLIAAGKVTLSKRSAAVETPKKQPGQLPGFLTPHHPQRKLFAAAENTNRKVTVLCIKSNNVD